MAGLLSLYTLNLSDEMSGKTLISLRRDVREKESQPAPSWRMSVCLAVGSDGFGYPSPVAPKEKCWDLFSDVSLRDEGFVETEKASPGLFRRMSDRSAVGPDVPGYSALDLGGETSRQFYSFRWNRS